MGFEATRGQNVLLQKLGGTTVVWPDCCIYLWSLQARGSHVPIKYLENLE